MKKVINKVNNFLLLPWVRGTINLVAGIIMLALLDYGVRNVGLGVRFIALCSLMSLYDFWSGIDAFRTIAYWRFTYGTFQPLAEPILTDHGDTFEAVMNGIRRAMFEYVASFTVDGKKLAESTLFSTWQTQHLLRSESAFGTVSLHNHPSRAMGSFSNEDIFALLYRREYQSYIVTGWLVYCMTNESYAEGELNMSEEECYRQLDMVRRAKTCNPLFDFLPYAFYRWYSIWCSYQIARRFNLKFQMGYIWRDKIHMFR